MKPKFKRRNFSEPEKHLLFSLTETEKHILECRDIQAHTLQEKRRTWEKVTQLFNAEKCVVTVPRSVDELRKCWMNQKYKLRQSVARDHPHASLNFGGNNPSPTLMNVDVDPVLINQSPEPVQNAWEGDLSTKNGQQPVTRSQTYDGDAAVPAAPTATTTGTTAASSQHSSETTRSTATNNIPNTVDFETTASSDSVWPVSLRPYQKRKLDAILDQDQKLTSSQLALSKLEEEKNKLQLKILNEQLKNVQKEADLLDRKIVLTDRKIQYWDRMFKTGGGHHHMFPNM